MRCRPTSLPSTCADVNVQSVTRGKWTKHSVPWRCTRTTESKRSWNLRPRPCWVFQQLHHTLASSSCSVHTLKDLKQTSEPGPKTNCSYLRVNDTDNNVSWFVNASFTGNPSLEREIWNLGPHYSRANYRFPSVVLFENFFVVLSLWHELPPGKCSIK